VVHNLIYGVGKGHIWMDDVQCNGREDSLSECSHRGLGVHNCDHSQDVAVSCVNVSSGKQQAQLSAAWEMYGTGLK